MSSNAFKNSVQHITVVFRIPGPREATAKFLTDLSIKFPDQQPEIVAIQVGNLLESIERAQSATSRTDSNKDGRTA